MEKQQLVEKSVYTNLVGDVENTILTNQLNIPYDNIQVVKTKIIYRGIEVSINEETFKTAVNNEEGWYIFNYDHNEDGVDYWWTDFLNREELVEISDYGITLSGGNPQGKDGVWVNYENGEISCGYIEHTLLFKDENNTFNFINFISSNFLSIGINENYEDGSRMVNLDSIKKLETELRDDITLEINLWNGDYKEDIEVVLILAKKVEEWNYTKP